MSRKRRYRPILDGDFWQVAGVPDLGAYDNGGAQEPVDFGIWQAADGSWQIWSCIRNTTAPGNGRVFYGWEGSSLTSVNWRPLGITMEADVSLGETRGGLQAPFVFRSGGVWHMFYGDGERICLATSTDGKHFSRYRNSKGEPSLFEGPYGNSRDVCVVDINGLYHCYYTGHREHAWPACAIFCRTSRDLRTWSTPVAVNYGGVASTKCDWFGGDAECPFVVPYRDTFILFRNQLYGSVQLNHQYCSDNPLDFGCDTDERLVGALEVTAPEIVLYEGRYYIACLMPYCRGIQIGRLKFEQVR